MVEILVLNSARFLVVSLETLNEVLVLSLDNLDIEYFFCKTI